MTIDIKKMVSNFLSWKLPSDFSPDCGIYFDKATKGNPFMQPIGTNLFTADQAKKMIEAMLVGAVVKNTLRDCINSDEENIKQSSTIAQLQAENLRLQAKAGESLSVSDFMKLGRSE